MRLQASRASVFSHILLACAGVLCFLGILMLFPTALQIALFTKVASTEVFTVIMALPALWYGVHRRWYEAGILVLTTLGLMLSVIALKEFFMVARPEGGMLALAGYGFPSGHGTGVMFLALVLWYWAVRETTLSRWTLAIVLSALVLVVGASRVYLGVHTPLQVMGGYMLGAVWFFAWFLLATRRSDRT